MALFRRGNAETLRSDVETVALASHEHERDASAGFDPYEFIDDHAIELDSSRNLWIDIAKQASELTGPKNKSIIREGLPEIYEASGIDVSEDILERDTEQVCRDMSVYTLLKARQLSGGKIGMAEGINLARQLVKTSDPNIGFLIGRSRRARVAFGDRIVHMAQRMQDADHISANVITSLSSGYADHPEGIVKLAELYADGAAKVNPRFAELKEMIGQDWHARLGHSSILRNFISDIAADPRAFVEGFSEQVENSKQDKRIALVRSFAEFTIAATDESERKMTLSEVMRASYEKWDRFDAIKRPFDMYVKAKLLAIERAVSDIAGPFRKNSIRTHRTETEFEEYKRTLRVVAGTRNSQALSATTKAKKRNSRPRALPTAEDLDEVVQTAEKGIAPRQLVVVKNAQTNGGFKAREISLSGIGQAFSVKKGNGLEGDLQKMVERLRDEPVSRASKKLVDNNNKIYIDGKSINLWRFAPNDAPQLQIHSDNRFMRVVYGFSKDIIYLVDILDHASFDKKYTSS